MEPKQRQRKRDWLRPSKWLELYSLWAYRLPLLIFSLITGVLILLVVGVVLKDSMETSDTDGDEWIIKTEEQTKRDQAIDEGVDALSSLINQRPRSEDDGFLKLTFVYTAKDTSGNMFTRKNLETMKKIENLVLQHEEYPNFCQLNYSSPDVQCIDQLTPLPFFFEFDGSARQYGDFRQSPEEGLEELRQDLFTNGFFLTKDFTSTGKSRNTRSRYSFGLPVNNRTNRNEEEDEQREFVYDNILKDLEEELWDLLGMDAKVFRTEYSQTGSLDTVEVVFAAGQISQEEAERAIGQDFTWALLAILVVWLYMLIHLGSFFLSLVGIFEVFMSFPAALFVYREAFSIDFFNELNIVVIFILLGIGADDIFVFTDAFKQSQNIRGIASSLKDRLAYTAHRASKAVFVTSFTTASAFFATAISELMPMQAFGIFAGLCIVFLFVINVLIMPPALVLWSRYIPCCVRSCCCCCSPICNSKCLKKCLPCCTCCHTSEDETMGLSGKMGNNVTVIGQPMNSSPQSEYAVENGGEPPHAPPEQQISMSMRDHDDENEVHTAPSFENPATMVRLLSLSEDVGSMRALERFFNGTFFKFLERTRFVIIVIGAVFFAIGLFYVTTFKAPEEQEDSWPSFHMFNKFNDLTGRDGPFLSDDEDAFATVHLVWGLKGMDTSDIDIWDATDFGNLIYDDNFDMTSIAAQRHLLNVCPQARGEACEADECRESCVDGDCQKFLVRFDRNTPDSFEPCWIEDMHLFLQNNETLNNTQGLPVEPQLFIPLLKEYIKSPNAVTKYQEQIGLFGDDLRFVQFELETTFRPPASQSKTEDVLDEWEDFMDRINEQAAAAGDGAERVSNGFQSGRFPWVWIFTQKALIDNARQGIFIVFVIAFVVLNLATGNVIISSLAILSVLGVVATVMGVGIRLIMDWDMGVAESIVSVILIGFSMDYTLHLADAYIESGHTTRAERTQDALTHLGISVTAGAATTLLSGLFLWGAIITFFTKFAFNITTTIISSYLWSMFFFPAMCLILGPEGDTGNWSTIFNYMKECISSRRESRNRETSDTAKPPSAGREQELASVTVQQGKCP